MRKATIAIKFEDLGWKIDTYVTTICCEIKFRKRFMDKYAGNMIEQVVILEWEKIGNLDEIDSNVNRTIITEKEFE